MKKIVKMSLVAAIALAGLTTANAAEFLQHDSKAPPGVTSSTYKQNVDTGIAAIAAFGGQKVGPGFWGKQTNDFQSIALIGCDVAGGTAHSLVASSLFAA